MDAGSDMSATLKLDAAGDLDDILAHLARLGVTARTARRSCAATFGVGENTTRMPLVVAYVVACPAGTEPRELAVPRRGPIG